MKKTIKKVSLVDKVFLPDGPVEPLTIDYNKTKGVNVSERRVKLENRFSLTTKPKTVKLP